MLKPFIMKIIGVIDKRKKINVITSIKYQYKYYNYMTFMLKKMVSINGVQFLSSILENLFEVLIKID